MPSRRRVRLGFQIFIAVVLVWSAVMFLALVIGVATQTGDRREGIGLIALDIIFILVAVGGEVRRRTLRKRGIQPVELFPEG